MPSPRPAPGTGPGQAPRPAPHTGGGWAPGGEPEDSDAEQDDGEWSFEENTRKIEKLGYVPRDARGAFDEESFDVDRETADDRSKYRKRRRAKKASIGARLGLAAIVIVVVVALVGGVWYLVSGGGSDAKSGPAFATLDKPCSPLDTSPMKSVINGAKLTKQQDTTEKQEHSSQQHCDMAFGGAGKGGDIQANSEVYRRDAGAKNAFDDAASESKDAVKQHADLQTFTKLSNVESGGFAVVRKPDAKSKTVDYSLNVYRDNVFLEIRVSVYNGAASERQVAGYSKDIAKKYLDNWAAQ
ncbi:MAG TPA: hypothetical protein VE172_24930 [Stackebrandtia sp.]|uniref:hypothetical protein n=1 Tax=Stackebrandtia sp. TaxID=2023065 RepID=UPI002D52C944|nr:hypothetical protein [Stackebrandtia sp.]HZE42054.1 hypothetical protein [Stackebrandtia sp.]